MELGLAEKIIKQQTKARFDQESMTLRRLAQAVKSLKHHFESDEQTTRRVITGVQAEGTCWCGGSVWQGHTAMRVSVSETRFSIMRSV